MQTFTFKKNIFISLLTFLMIIFSYTTVSAQSIELRSEDMVYNVGDSFLIEVRLNAMGKKINSFEGSLSIPHEYFDVSSIKTGDSIISLWTQNPVYKADTSELQFSGGLIGGYSGSDGPLFSFVVHVKKEGDATIGFKKIDAYLNDGYATAIPNIKINSVQYTLTNDSTRTPRLYTSNTDTEDPEQITVAIDRDSSIADNKYFVSFFAHDKGDGVRQYEIEERPWIISLFGFKKVWEDAQTPHVLTYQNWISTVVVRAIDESGNMSEQKIIKFFSFDVPVYAYLLLLTCILFIFRKYIKKEYNKK